ncbi:MAG: hypothetical protein OXF75_00410 [Acidimicrobiaceae bacterium]|nr:hypothetical protein [Acidimicrobiaceae bacterium]
MTATAASKPPAETTQEIVDSALERIAGATDFLELEQAWIEGLRRLPGPNDSKARARILAGAGRRLSAFGYVEDDIARRGWLRQIVEEAQLRGDATVDGELAAVATDELREAFARANPKIADLRAAVDAGETLQEFAIRCPLDADHVRDLGRIAEGLRGTGLVALCSEDDRRLACELAQTMKPPIHLLPTVPESLRVTRDDLLSWASSSRAAAEFPRLVRSLIAETEPSAEWIDMPAGTGVSSPGWDGVVRCARGNRFVPAGTSMWELTTQQSGTQAKVVDDYEKRVKNQLPAERDEIAYVSAACAPWTQAREFESEYSSKGDFSRVSALNVDSLEDWLACAVATTVWMREQINKPTVGIQLLAKWWEKWLTATTAPLDEGIVLAGREQDSADLRGRCEQQPGAITIGGQVHRDEIIAFVAAALGVGDAERVDAAHVLYVDCHDTAERLFAQESLSTQPSQQTNVPVLTMVVPSADYAQHLPARSPHRMIVPVPGSTQATIVLEPVDSELVRTQFEETGEELHEAYRLAGLARISLMALRRNLSVDPALHMPSWATGRADQTIRRSLLLGGWNEAHEGDREIVKKFINHSFEEVAEALRQLDAADSPMTSTGELWHAVSPEDTWMLLHNQLSPSDLDSFSAIALDVLTAPDPLRELSGEETLRDQIEGTKAKYSSRLKQGIATTLALAGSNPPTPRGEPTPTSTFAEGTTRRVLRSAMEDATPSTWIAITDTLPLLAEAAPGAVLESLRTCVAEQHAFTQVMFTDNTARLGFGSSSPHLRILNALEVIAWSPEHLLAVADVLARLDELDPGGMYTTRPATALASIMCTWMPYTSADAEDRLAALEMLRRFHPDVAWTLMLSMLPQHHSVQTPGALPQYRDWRAVQPVVTPQERAAMVSAVEEMILEDVDDDPGRWVQLIKRMNDMPNSIRRRSVSQLEELSDRAVPEQFKSAVWPELRNFTSRHREFSDSSWTLPESDLQVLDQLIQRLRPSAHDAAFGYLFSADLRSVDAVRAVDGHEEFQEALQSRQTGAVETILADGGMQAVLEFAVTVDSPRSAGFALASCDPTLDHDVLQIMEEVTAEITSFSLGYFSRRFATLGWEGFERIIKDRGVSSQVAADILRAAPPAARAWSRVDAHRSDIAAEYWSRISFYDIGGIDELSDLLKISRQLREAERVDLAVNLLARRSDSHSSESEIAEEVAAALEQWVNHPGKDKGESATTQRGLKTLIELLNDHRDHLGTGRVAILEWQYLPLLQRGMRFDAPNLYREMARDPALFVQLVETAFKPANRAPAEQTTLTEAQQHAAHNAWEVLNHWPPVHFAPALNDNGDLDAGSLDEWVDETREKLAAIDRADIGDQMIGTALAFSPPDSNGDWPGEAVRNLLERLQTAQVDQGLECGILNQRGVTSRSATDGGEQERQLAGNYRAQARRFQKWPRTAEILRGLAESYEREAGINDREAETVRRGIF